MIDIDKKYRTRDGREVRIYAVDGGGSHPVHGAIKSTEGWDCHSWRRTGCWMHPEGLLDLIEGTCDPVEASIKRAVWF
jgi:hypothetical protein